jgi:serine-type D-Ala-D-Ala carboxypeptidase/endopeptidase (penicillin-binding protein 4)
LTKLFQILFLPLLLFLLSFLLSSCASLQPAAVTNSAPIDSLLTREIFNTAQAGISVYDLTENKLLYRHNPQLLFRPASNQKILTTAAASLFLGDDYNFSTSVYHSGEIKDSILHGNIFFKGGFDPAFTIKNLDSLVKQIKNYGVKEVAGNLYVDISAMDSLYWGKGWMWDDDIPYISPLTIDGNTIKIIARPGDIGTPANIQMIPETGCCKVKNFSQTVQSEPKTLYTTRELNNGNVFVLKGNLPIQSSPDTLSLVIVNINQYLLNLTKESFIRNGISFNGNIDTLSLPIESKKIFSVEHNIVPVIVQTNKVSDNLYAELILRALASKYFGKHATAQNGITMLDSLIKLAGFNSKDYRLADGSGLSFYNLVSAQLITGVLKYIFYEHPQMFHRFFDSLPIAGIDGTLSARMKGTNAIAKVHAKTGSLSGVSTLSGYIQTKNDHMIAFSIMIQNYVGSAEQARIIQDKICEIIFNKY